MLSLDLLTDKQNDAIDFIYERDYSLLALPMGFGKTVCSLTAASELLENGTIKKVMVATTAKARDLTWASEHKKWRELESLNVSIFPDVSGDVVITSYNQMGAALKSAVFDGLILDELTKLKSSGGAWFKSLRRFLPKFTWRVGLTGTLAEEGLDKLYSMVLAVDGGKTFGRRKDLFMQEYFVQMDYMGYKWEPKPDTRERMSKLMSPFTLTIEGDDQALPQLNVEHLYVDLAVPTRDAYVQMARHMALTDDITAANEAVLVGKLQQLANGFVYSDEKAVGWVGMEKVDEIVEQIERWRGQSPVLVVYTHVAMLRELQGRYPEAPVLGDKCSRGAAVEIADSWNQGDTPVLFVHPASAGHGLNLQRGGNVVLFTGPIWSRDQHDQVIARLWRRGCPFDAVHAVTVVARDTVEDKVIAPRLEDKREAAELFRGHLASV